MPEPEPKRRRGRNLPPPPRLNKCGPDHMEGEKRYVSPSGLVRCLACMATYQAPSKWRSLLRRLRRTPELRPLAAAMEAVYEASGKNISIPAAARKLVTAGDPAAGLLETAGIAPKSVDDEMVLPVLEEIVEHAGRAASARQIAEALAEAGVPKVKRSRVVKLVADAGLKAVTRGTPEGAERAPGESLRWDGYLTTTQVAQWFECDPPVVSRAVRNGELTARGRQGQQNLFDPKRIAGRKDGRTGPVDSDHPLALPPPVR